MRADQCRAARGLLGIDQTQLAEMSGVSRNTVADFEAENREPRRKSVAAIRDALAARGIVFLGADHDPGVQLRFVFAEPAAVDGFQVVKASVRPSDAPSRCWPERALASADVAERRGEEHVAAALRRAARCAIERESPFVAEAIERYDRLRRALDAYEFSPSKTVETEALYLREAAVLQKFNEELVALRGRELA